MKTTILFFLFVNTICFSQVDLSKDQVKKFNKFSKGLCEFRKDSRLEFYGYFGQTINVVPVLAKDPNVKIDVYSYYNECFEKIKIRFNLKQLGYGSEYDSIVVFPGMKKNYKTSKKIGVKVVPNGDGTVTIENESFIDVIKSAHSFNQSVNFLFFKRTSKFWSTSISAGKLKSKIGCVFNTYDNIPTENHCP